MQGTEVKQMIIAAGIPLWKIADGLGITDSTFSRKLRHSFDDEAVNRIKAIICELTKNND